MHTDRKKRFAALFLALLFLPLFSLSAKADEPEAEEESMAFMDTAELDELLKPMLEHYGATEKNFGLIFTYTGTGETYMINPDAAMYGASLYKLPLCMLYAEKVGLGEMDYNTLVQYQPLSLLMEQTLVYSKNDTAASLYFSTNAPYDEYLLNSYTDLTPEELPEWFKDFYFSPRFIHQTLMTLYNDPDRFPGIIDYMKQASPNYFFRKNLEGQYEVAQKYGEFEGVLHTAGIIYTPTPIILVVMCDRMPYQLEAIEELGEFFAEYSLTMDERREAMEDKKAAEEQARQEAEALAAEQAAEEKAAAEAAAELEAQLRAKEDAHAALMLQIRNTAVLVVVAGLTAFVSLLLLKKLKSSEKET